MGELLRSREMHAREERGDIGRNTQSIEFGAFALPSVAITEIELPGMRHVPKPLEHIGLSIASGRAALLQGALGSLKQRREDGRRGVEPIVGRLIIAAEHEIHWPLQPRLIA